MRRHHSLRASDADRDAVVDRLRDAAGDGRLEPDELEQRVDGALRARTYGDLGALLADLPSDGRMPLYPAARRTGSLGRSAALGAGLLVAATLAVALVAIVVLVALAAAVCWIAVVLLWRACNGSRRRLPHAHRARPTGFP
jgi:hypothetical protein